LQQGNLDEKINTVKNILKNHNLNKIVLFSGERDSAEECIG
jgi:hypothetical protein